MRRSPARGRHCPARRSRAAGVRSSDVAGTIRKIDAANGDLLAYVSGQDTVLEQIDRDGESARHGRAGH